jgi:thioredoxin 1
MGGGVAPVPAGFDKAVTIASATSASTSDGKPVLMMVTADWCGPCQTLKRDALADPRVVEAMKSRTHSVYVDATKSTPAEVAPFSIEGFPTLLMVKDGKEVGRLVGVKPADAVLAWINSNS